MVPATRLPKEFYIRDVLDVAPDLIGKSLVIRSANASVIRYRVTDVEAYRGSDDKACHASKGRTGRTEIMFHEGGHIYMYLVYGMYWMLNVVTGPENIPQAILLRGVENHPGPGIITKSFDIDRSYYGEALYNSERIWFEDSGFTPAIKTGMRIGIDYSGEFWKTRPWRFYSVL